MKSDFAEILYPYEIPEKIDDSAQENNLRLAKVFFKNKENPYLLISKQCKDHSEKIRLIQCFYFQYECSHPAIMPINRLSLTPTNRIEAYYNFPENGRLSNFIGFAHENKPLIETNTLTPTNKTIISYGLAHALRYIHQLGYQFCDVNAKNIYLDSNFHPFLTNFYSIKKLDDTTHESAKKSSIQLKTDIFSYSIIYAALIEPVTFDPPVHTSNEFFQNLSNRKRPACHGATENQRKVLDKMWDYVPRDRIDFDQIIDYFNKGDLVFPGTEIEEFEEYKIKINSAIKSLNTPPSTPIKSRFSSASSSPYSSPLKSPNSSPGPSPDFIKRLAASVINNE